MLAILPVGHPNVTDKTHALGFRRGFAVALGLSLIAFDGILAAASHVSVAPFLWGMAAVGGLIAGQGLRGPQNP